MKTSLGNVPRFLLLCGILAPVTMMAVIIIVGLLTPGYDPISSTISQMGTPDKPYAFLLNGGYFIYGLLIIAAAYGLYQTLAFTPIAGRVAILVSFHGIFTVLLGVFTDVPDIHQRFMAHIVHDIVSILSYVPLMIGILVFRKIAKQDMTLKVTCILGLVIVTAALFSPAFTLFAPLRPISGLLQRIITGGTFAWLTLTFFLLYRKRRRLYGSVETRRSKSKKYPTQQSDLSDLKTTSPVE